MAALLPSSWAELPPDLLGLVLRRLPSLADRVRVRAVCRPWRAGAHPKRMPLPPPLPWLALRDGSLVDLDGAPVRCPSILSDGVFDYLAVDNLAFRVHHDGGCSLMNPLTGWTLPLPELGPAVRRVMREPTAYDDLYILKLHVKAILSSSPLDSTELDPFVAEMILYGHGLAISACRQHDATSISLCSEIPGGLRSIDDIAFFHGKLYILMEQEGLHVINLHAGHLSELNSPSCFHQCIADDPEQQQIYCTEQLSGPDSYADYLVLRYLAESNGRLLMIRRWMSTPREARLGDNDITLHFEVLEADLATVPGRWTKVESLGEQAIFLGSECSKSVLASQCAGGVQEDCIYFMHMVYDNPGRERSGPCVDPLRDSGVFNMRNGEITPFLTDTVMDELRRKRQFLTWFFPADA